MRKFNKFITAICVLFVVKLRWPKNKILYDTTFSKLVGSFYTLRLYAWGFWGEFLSRYVEGR